MPSTLLSTTWFWFRNFRLRAVSLKMFQLISSFGATASALGMRRLNSQPVTATASPAAPTQ